MNVRTQQSTFVYKKSAGAAGVTVNGTFMTEAFFTANADKKTLRYSQSAIRAYTTNWGWFMSNGTCDGKKIAAIPHHKVTCGSFGASTDLSSTTFKFGGWRVEIETRKVFLRVSGASKRIDIKISGVRNSNSHGIIGQSFRVDYNRQSGKTDSYPLSGNFTTEAQAEGAIEGTYLMYKMGGPYDTDFAFSAFGGESDSGGLYSYSSDLYEMDASASDPNMIDYE